MKKIMALAVAFAMTVSMTACSGGDEGTSSGAGSAAEKAIEISIPSFKTGENVGAVFFLPQVERFNKKYEGKYKIKIEEVPQASYADKLKQLAQQKKLPVLMHSGVDNEWFKKVAIPNDMCYDLSGWLEESKEIRPYMQEDSIEYSTRDGKLVTSPLAVVRPMALFYNTVLYQPDTAIHDMSMEDFLTSLGDQKIALQTADNGWCTMLLLSGLIANEEGGEDLLRDNVDEKLTDYNHPAMIAAVTKLQQVFQKNAAANSVGAAYADAANSFLSEKAAVILNGAWMSSEFLPENKDKWSNSFDGKNVRADLMPSNIGVANTRSFGEWWVSNSATDQEKELAKAFLTFTYSKEELEAYMLAEGGSCPGLEYSEEFLAKQKENQVLADLSDASTSDTVFVPALADIMPTSVIETEFGKLLPKLADGTMSPESFCGELTTKAKAAVA